jgi:hypothetical protein
VRLVPDHRDRAGEAFLAKRFDSAEAGERRTDDRYGVQRLPLEGDGLLGAATNGFFDLAAQLFGRVLLQHVEEVVISNLEHLGRGLHTERVALAEIEVDHDLHPFASKWSRSGRATYRSLGCDVRGPADGMSNSTARRIALAAQGFTDPQPSGRVDLRHIRRALGRVGVLQIDSVNVLVRSHELPLFSRLGPYPRQSLTDLAERRRELFEYWGHMASFVPVRFHPLLRWRMKRAEQHAWRHVSALQRDHPGYVEAVLAEVAAHGPIPASALSEPGEKSGPWWGWANGKAALEWLFFTGEVASAGRGRNFERFYDLSERVIPGSVLALPTPSVEDAHRSLLLESARWLGIGTAGDIADYFRIKVTEARPRLNELVEAGELLPVHVEGWKQPAYLHPSARVPRHVRARALLSPFDSLVWNRERTQRIFGMRYRIEVYTPAAQRVHGYYVLPFLLDDELVARVDLKADRKHSTLRMPGAHLELAHVGADRAKVVASELEAELRSMADWLELDHVSPARVQFR